MGASPQAARLFRSIAPPLPKKPYGFPGTPYMLDFMAGQEYHYPYCLSSPHREPPGVFSLLFLAPWRMGQTGDLFSIRWRLVVSVPQIMAQPLIWLMLFGKSNRKVPDEWVFIFQRAPHPSFSQKWGGGNLSLHPIAAGNPRFSPLLTKVF